MAHGKWKKQPKPMKLAPMMNMGTLAASRTPPQKASRVVVYLGAVGVWGVSIM